MEEKSQILNPQVKMVTIGKRYLREVFIYPLSAADQIKISNVLSESLQGLIKMAGGSEIEFIDFIRQIIGDNLGTVLSYITDEGAELAEDITNDQALEIVEIVYTVNYVSLKKKLTVLFQKMKEKGLNLGKLSPVSSDITPSTDLKTSIESPIETED